MLSAAQKNSIFACVSVIQDCCGEKLGFGKGMIIAVGSGWRVWVVTDAMVYGILVTLMLILFLYLCERSIASLQSSAGGSLIVRFAQCQLKEAKFSGASFGSLVVSLTSKRLLECMFCETAC